MPVVRHCSRIDTFELKLQMKRSLGAQKSESYLNLLTRYLSLKVGKSEFDKLCIRLIGRENIRLHNELIRAILKNVVCKTPPPKQVKHDIALTFKDSNGGLQSICRDVFPQSPRKGHTQILRERKLKDRPSPLGVDDKNHMAEDVATTRGIKPPSEVSYRRIPITAPFGIDIHSNEKRKVSCNNSCSGYYAETCHYSGWLPSGNSLENRLKHKLKSEGLDISIECVNLLINGLDGYLKRVMKPSLELASLRSLHEPGKRFTASLLDFQVASMINPKTLGEDWSVQLEKICLSGFDNK